MVQDNKVQEKKNGIQEQNPLMPSFGILECE